MEAFINISAVVFYIIAGVPFAALMSAGCWQIGVPILIVIMVVCYFHSKWFWDMDRVMRNEYRKRLR